MGHAIRQAPYYLVFDGQSLNRTGGYPIKVRTATGYGATFMPYRIAAISGLDWETLAGSFATRTAPHAKTGAVNTLMLNGGQTGCSEGDSAATLRSNAAAYADLGFAAGFDHVLVTTIPAASSAYYDAAAETQRQSFNSTLLSTGVSSGDFSAVVDIASAIDAVADPDGTDPTYYADIVHWTPAGAQVAADVVGPALLTLLGLP